MAMFGRGTAICGHSEVSTEVRIIILGCGGVLERLTDGTDARCCSRDHGGPVTCPRGVRARIPQARALVRPSVSKTTGRGDERGVIEAVVLEG